MRRTRKLVLILASFALLTVHVAAADKPAPKPRPESSMTAGPDGGELAPGKVNLLGKVTSFEQFLKTCRESNGRSLEAGALAGRAVKIVGPLKSVDESGWTVFSKEDKKKGTWDQPVSINLTEMGDIEDAELNGFRVGNMVCVYGIAGEGASVRAWRVELLPPGLAWQTALRTPQAIVAGQSQTFSVDCAVKNTGRQTLRNIEFGVRLMQVESPNNKVQTYTIETLAPGQTANFTIDFELFNYQYIGKTSVPSGQATVLSYEL